MENSLVPLPELRKFIVKDFQVEENDLPLLEDLNDVKRKLTEVIRHLLDKDMNKLLNIFYRIDLKEHQVKSILTQSPVAEIASRLAELVIEREIEKIRTRSKYKTF